MIRKSVASSEIEFPVSIETITPEQSEKEYARRNRQTYRCERKIKAMFFKVEVFATQILFSLLSFYLFV